MKMLKIILGIPLVRYVFIVNKLLSNYLLVRAPHNDTRVVLSMTKKGFIIQKENWRYEESNSEKMGDSIEGK